jgi:hypothetical protein
MKRAKAKGAEEDSKKHSPHRVSLPAFILDEDIGLGSVVKRVTTTFGIRTCGGCEKRAAKLDRWLRFTSSRRK